MKSKIFTCLVVVLLCVVTGCGSIGGQKAPERESGEETAAEASASDAQEESTVPEEPDAEATEAAAESEDEEVATDGRLRLSAEVQEAMKLENYAAYVERYGDKAIHWYGGYFPAPLSESGTGITFIGDGDPAENREPYLEPESGWQYISGPMGFIYENMPEQATLNELMEMRSMGGEEAVATWMTDESGGDMIADYFVEIRYDADANGAFDSCIHIALEEEWQDTVTNETYTWLFHPDYAMEMLEWKWE